MARWIKQHAVLLIGVAAELLTVFLAPGLGEGWAGSSRWRSALEVDGNSRLAGTNLAKWLVLAAGFVLVGVVLLRLSRRDDELRAWTWRRVPHERAMLAFAALGGACTVVVAQVFGGAGVFPVSRTGDWGSIDVAFHALLLATAIVFAPIAEELTCRGFLFIGLRRLVGTWIAMLCVTAAFVAGHRRTEGLSVLIGMGLWLMWSAQAGGVLAAIVAHASSNVIAVALFYREHLPGPVAWLDTREGGTRNGRLALAVLGLVVCAWGMFRLFRRARSAAGDAASDPMR